MNIFVKLVDANLFTLKMPNSGDRTLVVGIIHPFDLDDRGYEARIYKLMPERVVLSQPAIEAAAFGWGVDDVKICPDGSIELSRDEEFSLKIWASLPCELALKCTYFSSYPECSDDGVPPELLKLYNAPAPEWQTVMVAVCPQLV